MAHASISHPQVKGQLAGLTMRLKSSTYGFSQNLWPVEIDWGPGGVATYRLPAELAGPWRQVRGAAVPPASDTREHLADQDGHE